VLTAKDVGTARVVGQYIRFARIADEQRDLYPEDHAKAAAETIRICLEKGILTEFIESRREELTDILETIFDQERVFAQYVKEQRNEERNERNNEIAANLLKEGLSEDVISRVTNLPIEKVRELRGI